MGDLRYKIVHELDRPDVLQAADLYIISLQLRVLLETPASQVLARVINKQERIFSKIAMGQLEKCQG